MKNLIIPAVIGIGGFFALGGKKKKKKKSSKKKQKDDSGDIVRTDADEVHSEGTYAMSSREDIDYRVVGNKVDGYYGQADVSGEFKTITGGNRFPTPVETVSEIELVLSSMDKEGKAAAQKKKCEEFFSAVHEPNPGPGELSIKDVAVTQDILPHLEKSAQAIRTAKGQPLGEQDLGSIVLDTLNKIAPECKVTFSAGRFSYTDAKLPFTNVMIEVMDGIYALADETINVINKKNPVLTLDPNQPGQGATVDPNAGFGGTNTGPTTFPAQN